jgi:predicted kinase
MAGLPGTGKSAIAEKIRERLGYPLISVDPLESAILSAGIDADQPTGLAAYLVAETLASTVLESGSSIIIDAVNAVNPAREQWVNLAARHGAALTFVEIICSDPAIHRERLEKRNRNLPHVSEPSWHAVEQSLDEYDSWTGQSAVVARITLDSVNPLGANVEAALAFLAS